MELSTALEPLPATAVRWLKRFRALILYTDAGSTFFRCFSLLVPPDLVFRRFAAAVCAQPRESLEPWANTIHRRRPLEAWEGAGVQII